MTLLRSCTGMLCALLPLAGASAGDASEPPGPPERTELRQPVVRAPLDVTASTPVIEARINGSGPFRFILDTGASGTVLFAQLVKELALPVTGKAKLGDPSDPDAIDVDRVRIDTITIGDAVFYEVEADAWDAPAHFGAADIRGILGFSVFFDCLMTFDFDRNRLILQKGELPPADDAEILAYEMRDDVPTVQLVLGDVRVAAHIDSGAPSTFILPENMQQRLKLQGTPVVVGRGRTINSEFDILSATLDGNARLGRHVFQRPQVKFINMLNDVGVANIGSGILRRFTVTFDQTNRRVRFADPKGLEDREEL